MGRGILESFIGDGSVTIRTDMGEKIARRMAEWELEKEAFIHLINDRGEGIVDYTYRSHP